VANVRLAAPGRLHLRRLDVEPEHRESGLPEHERDPQRNVRLPDDSDGCGTRRDSLSDVLHGCPGVRVLARDH
jgi:hypothetical protein